MYRIYADDVLIYNDSTPDIESTKLIGPSLSLKDNAAGSFDATIPIGNVCYDTIACFDTNIAIFRINQDGSDTWIWSGRVLKISKDFYNYKKITCEGVLAYLNDTVVPVGKIERYDLRQYVSFLLDMHNQKVAYPRRIRVGAVSASNSKGMSIGFHDYEFDGDNVLSYLGKAIEDWGLHVRIRMEATSTSLFVLDLLTDTQLPMAHQPVNFGQNLLDYSSEYDWSELVTAILPYGGEIDTNEETEDEEIPDRYTIEGLQPSSPNFVIDGKYLINITAAQEHGRIEQTVEWSDIEDPAELLPLAEAYLNDYNYATNTLNVTVLDLHYLMGSNYEAFDFLSQINCYSVPHGLRDTFIVKEMNIPFDNPENTTFSMSKETRGYYGSDRKFSSGGSSKLSAASSHIPSREGILRMARENAAAMIDMATNGYVTLVPISKDDGDGDRTGDRTWAITITNAIDMENSTQMWKWTLGGLMFVDRSSISDDWNPPAVALTMDGQIVATRITTGTLAVDDGNGGYLLLADMDSNTMQVAGFDFFTDHFTHEKSSIDDDSTDGIYMGLDGIAIGESGSRLFKVSLTDDLVKLLSGKTSIDDDDIAGFYLSNDGIAIGESSTGLFKVITGGDDNKVALLSNKGSVDDDDVDGFYLSWDGLAIGQNGTGLFKVDVLNNTAKISGFNFDDTKLWTLNRNSLTNNEPGFYIGTDGLSNSNGQNTMNITNGRLEGYLNGDYAGYFHAGYRNETTNRAGVVIGGQGNVVISTPSFGVADYVAGDYTGQLQYHEGKTETFAVVTGSGSSSSYGSSSSSGSSTTVSFQYEVPTLRFKSSTSGDLVLNTDSEGKVTSTMHVTVTEYETGTETKTAQVTLNTKNLIFNKGIFVDN